MRDSLLIPPLILSGLKYKDSKMARKAGCEFCYLIVPSSTRSPNNPIFKLTNTGNYQAYLYQRPDQYKMKILVLSIQYDFQVLKYQYRYSIWRILNKYQYQYAKKTEVSVFSISILSGKKCEKNKQTKLMWKIEANLSFYWIYISLKIWVI